MGGYGRIIQLFSLDFPLYRIKQYSSLHMYIMTQVLKVTVKLVGKPWIHIHHRAAFEIVT